MSVNPAFSSVEMGALVREAADLAYTRLHYAQDGDYVRWEEVTPRIQDCWCLAIEAGLAYALAQLFPEGPSDADVHHP